MYNNRLFEVNWDYLEEVRPKNESQKSVNPEAAYSLVNLISKLSEDYFFAGWLTGIEYALWDTVEGSSPIKPFSQEEIKQLRGLSIVCQGWWYWNDDSGEKFISLSNWMRRTNRLKKNRDGGSV